MGAAFCVPDSWDEATREAAMHKLAAMGLPAALARDAAALHASGADDAARAAWALARAQAAGYVPDPAACEWYQSPDVTAAHGGDCDDLCILLVALARALDLPCRIVRLPQPGAAEDHVLCTVWARGAWRWAEPSIAGARLGEHPADALRRLNR